MLKESIKGTKRQVAQKILLSSLRKEKRKQEIWVGKSNNLRKMPRKREFGYLNPCSDIICQIILIIVFYNRPFMNDQERLWFRCCNAEVLIDLKHQKLILTNRPRGQYMLVDEIKTHLFERTELKNINGFLLRRQISFKTRLGKKKFWT